MDEVCRPGKVNIKAGYSDAQPVLSVGSAAGGNRADTCFKVSAAVAFRLVSAVWHNGYTLRKVDKADAVLRKVAIGHLSQPLTCGSQAARHSSILSRACPKSVESRSVLRQISGLAQVKSVQAVSQSELGQNSVRSQLTQSRSRCQSDHGRVSGHSRSKIGVGLLSGQVRSVRTRSACSQNSVKSWWKVKQMSVK